MVVSFILEEPSCDFGVGNLRIFADRLEKCNQFITKNNKYYLCNRQIIFEGDFGESTVTFFLHHIDRSKVVLHLGNKILNTKIELM